MFYVSYIITLAITNAFDQSPSDGNPIEGIMAMAKTLQRFR
jgi:hypothetical protein